MVIDDITVDVVVKKKLNNSMQSHKQFINTFNKVRTFFVQKYLTARPRRRQKVTQVSKYNVGFSAIS